MLLNVLCSVLNVCSGFMVVNLIMKLFFIISLRGHVGECIVVVGVG